MKKIIIIFSMLFILISCGSKNTSDKWSCIEDGTVMYSIDKNGTLGGAGKGCSCEKIYNFELKTFGEVDTKALEENFGCEF